MKKIEAFIKAHRLDEVVRVLCGIEGVTGITVTDAHGFGRGRGGTETLPKVTEMTGKFLQTVRIEVFCRDALRKL